MDFTTPRMVGERNRSGGRRRLRPQLCDPTKVAVESWYCRQGQGPKSGRVMECLTTQRRAALYRQLPGWQQVGIGGHKYEKHDALCLETQHIPIHQTSEFPSTTLRLGRCITRKQCISLGGLSFVFFLSD